MSIIIGTWGHYLDFQELLALGLKPIVWQMIGYGLFVVAVLTIVMGYSREQKKLKQELIAIKNERNKTTNDTRGGIKDSTAIKGIEYYTNRNELPKISEEFKDVRKAWVLWYTGYGAYGYGIHLKKHSSGDRKIERIILLHPKLNYQPLFVDYLVNKIDYSSESAEQSVLDISRGVLKSKDYPRKVRIKWLDMMPPALYVINNPNGDDAWVRVEAFDLNKRVDEWQSYRIYKNEHLWVFNELKRAYEELWTKSDDIELAGEEICVRKA